MLPVIVSVAERSDRDGEGLPHRIQRVLHHLSLVADGEPGDAGRKGFKVWIFLRWGCIRDKYLYLSIVSGVGDIRQSANPTYRSSLNF